MLSNRLVLLASLVVGIGATYPAQADPAVPGADLHTNAPRQGWFWYVDPKHKDRNTQQDDAAPASELPAPVQPSGPVVVITGGSAATKCKAKDTWTANCGFIEPGEDFDFQAKQRDALLQQMAMRPSDPDAVEAAQRYMKFVVTKASQAANMWYFNMVQKPDLDPNVANPVSEVGIALASRASKATQNEYFRIIREEGGVLFFFSRMDCQFCHDQAPYARRVARTMGLTIINVPLDGKCLPGFDGELCGDNIKPEQLDALDLRTVPTIYLFVPTNTWIRLGTGIVTDTTVIANTVNFFSAYRAALLSGLDNSKGNRPSVTFDTAVNAPSTGVVAADGAKPLATPDRSQIMDMMGYPSKGGHSKTAPDN